MQISKHDTLTPKLAKIEDKNPLNAMDVTVDLLYADESFTQQDVTGAYKLHEKDLFEALRTLYSGMFVNFNDEVPLSLYSGMIIVKVKVSRIENIKSEYRHLKYGVIEDQTELNSKPSKASAGKVKILSDRVQEKQIFKKNFNF